MGDVETTSKALERVMLTGSPQPILPLERFILHHKGTINQKLMAVGAALNLPQSISDFLSPSPFLQAAIDLADDTLTDEEERGPRPKEILCPDPHEGMYLYGRMGIIAAGMKAPLGSIIDELGLRASLILSQELRLADLVATPDGDCTGLPGMRAPNGANLGRRALTNLRTVVREAQGFNVVLRGPNGGKRRSLKWSDKSDRLVDGPAYWIMKLFNTRLLDILSPIADLPQCLVLPLTIHRWNGGTLAYLSDPGPEQRKRFIVRGSAAAKRDKSDHDEDPVDWIRVEWRKPGRHIVTAGSSWETPVPLDDIPHTPKQTTVITIQGIKNGSI